MFLFQCIWQKIADRNNKHCSPRFVMAHSVLAYTIKWPIKDIINLGLPDALLIRVQISMGSGHTYSYKAIFCQIH
jgi:hypothetical protein